MGSFLFSPFVSKSIGNGMHSDRQTCATIRAAMEAHRELRRDFLDAAYQETLAIEMFARQITFWREALTNFEPPSLGDQKLTLNHPDNFQNLRPSAQSART
jgi:PD-(D/E)XK nuclease superfamily